MRDRTLGGRLAAGLLGTLVGALAQPCVVSSPQSLGFAHSEGPTNYNVRLRPLGQLRALLVLVDFPDAPADESAEAVWAQIVPGVRQWFSEVSYGRMDLWATTTPKWYRLPRRSQDYGIARGLSFDQHRRFFSDAIAAADPDVDFSAYQIVYLVASRESAIRFSPGFEANPGAGIRADGVEVRHGMTLGTDIRASTNVLIHETGHLFGLPDLYDTSALSTSSTHRFAGVWDPMSWFETLSDFTAWHKWKLGWLDTSQIRCLGQGQVEENLTPVSIPGGLKAIVAQVSESRAVVVESRNPSGRDSAFCDSGILIYMVDAAAPDGAGPLRVRPSNISSDLEKTRRCGPLFDAPWDARRDKNSRFIDAETGVSVEVLGTFRVRVINPVAPPPVLAGAASVAFTVDAGATQSQQYSLTSGATSVAYTAVTAEPWLAVEPAQATTPATLTLTARTAGLAPGTYRGILRVTAAAASNSPLTVAVELTVRVPPPPPVTPSLATVVNAASFQPGLVAPGELVTLFGSALGPGTLTGLRLAGGRVDTTLADTRVWFDGVAAPLLYVSDRQTSAIVPFSVAGRPRTEVAVEFRGGRSNPLSLAVAAAAPALFTADSSGRGQGAILNQDGLLNGATQAAARGSVVVLYATGAGQMSPSGPDGAITGAELARVLGEVQVTIGGQRAEVLYAGAAPGLVAGVVQINAQIPPDIDTGDAVPVRLTVSGVASPAGVTLVVR